MSFHVVTILVVLNLLSPVSSQGCGATRKIHASALKSPYTIRPTQICDQLDKSCCSIVTEFNMKNTAKDFSKLLFMSAKSITLDGMLPVGLPPNYVDLIEKRIKGEEVSYEQLTKTVIGYYVKESCLEQEGIEKLVRKSIPYVKSMADKYYALSVGSKAIVESLSTLPNFELSQECQNALIKNGIPTNKMLKNEYCQVCSKATIKERTCKSLCDNTLNGCISELTGVSEILNDLVADMDVLYANLLTEMISSDGAMTMLEKTVRSQFLDGNVDCNIGNSSFEASAMTVNQKFFSDTKKLGKYFENVIKFPCALSNARQFKCWTGEGMVKSYTISEYPIYKFTTEQQLMNPVLARTTPRSDVVMLEKSLSDAANVASDALEGIDLFVVTEYEPEVIESTEIEESGEEEKSDGAEGDVIEEEDKSNVVEDKSETKEEEEVEQKTETKEEKEEENYVMIENKSETKEEDVTDSEVMIGDKKEGDVANKEDVKKTNIGDEKDKKKENKINMEADKSDGEETNKVSVDNKKPEVKKEDKKEDVGKDNNSDLDLTVEEGASSSGKKENSAVSSSISIMINALSLILCVVGA